VPSWRRKERFHPTYTRTTKEKKKKGRKHAHLQHEARFCALRCTRLNAAGISEEKVGSDEDFAHTAELAFRFQRKGLLDGHWLQDGLRSFDRLTPGLGGTTNCLLYVYLVALFIEIKRKRILRGTFSLSFRIPSAILSKSTGVI
jgi:hypothetical protein